MAVKKFDPTGDFAAHIVRYLLQKAKEALGSGVSASEGDFTWQTFGKVNGPLAQSISDVHPGGQHDHQRLARVNYNRQASKFVRWLADGRGYPKTFALKAGLIESKLGGSEGDIKVGSDNDYSDHGEEEDEEEIPFADAATPKKKPSKVTPIKSTGVNKKSPTRAFDLHAITEKLEDIYRDQDNESEEGAFNDHDDMQILTVVKTDVTVTGYAPVKYQDLLVMQALMIGGGVVSTIRVEINRDNPNEGKVSIDQDPHVVIGSRRTKKEWKSGNGKLADDLEALFDIECKEKFVLEGTTPAYSKVESTFTWPNKLKSQLNPVDPFVLGFRSSQSSAGQTLFETKTIRTKNRDGKVVPAMLLTVFFFVEKHTHINNMAGSGLRVELTASDSDSEGSFSPRARGTPNKKRRTAGGGTSSSSSTAQQYAAAAYAAAAAAPRSNTVPMETVTDEMERAEDDSIFSAFMKQPPATNNPLSSRSSSRKQK